MAKKKLLNYEVTVNVLGDKGFEDHLYQVTGKVKGKFDKAMSMESSENQLKFLEAQSSDNAYLLRVDYL